MQILSFTLLFLLLSLSPVKAEEPREADNTAARILAYFMVGQDTIPEANIRTEQFEEHMRILSSAEYNVMPLHKIIFEWAQGRNLPPNTISITFDGGHKSILTYAAPILEKYELPYTVFIASERANQNSPQYLNWQDIKKLQKTKLMSVGMHPSTYGHYKDFETFKRQFNSARASMREALSYNPRLFSFPFGEYTQEALEHVTKQGFKAVGQHSGAAYIDLMDGVIPRFTMNEFFGDETRLNMILDTLPLAAENIDPIETISSDIKKAHTAFGFTAINGNENITCYSNGSNPLTVEKLDSGRIEMRSEWRVLDRRLRINCTAPAYDDKIRWFGFLAVR